MANDGDEANMIASGLQTVPTQQSPQKSSMVNDGDATEMLPISQLEEQSVQKDQTQKNEEPIQEGSQFFKDEEVVTDFRSTSSGNARSSFWSSSDDESSARYNTNRSSWNRKRFEHDDKESSNSNRLETDLTKERIALGLTGSGPLSLEHVKDAYRSCALKWHPDRHDGSSKVTFQMGRAGTGWVRLGWS
ncbi:hypothetical protein R6Q59_028456 [Mikania micrantha]